MESVCLRYGLTFRGWLPKSPPEYFPFIFTWQAPFTRFPTIYWLVPRMYGFNCIDIQSDDTNKLWERTKNLWDTMNKSWDESKKLWEPTNKSWETLYQRYSNKSYQFGCYFNGATRIHVPNQEITHIMFEPFDIVSQIMKIEYRSFFRCSFVLLTT